MSEKWDAGEHEGCGADSERAFSKWKKDRRQVNPCLVAETIKPRHPIKDDPA